MKRKNKKFCINRVEELELLIKQSEGAIKIETENTSYHDNKQIERIKSTVLCRKPNVKFSDVCGLEDEKEALEAAVILPVRFPELYSKKLSYFLV